MVDLSNGSRLDLIRRLRRYTGHVTAGLSTIHHRSDISILSLTNPRFTLLIPRSSPDPRQMFACPISWDTRLFHLTLGAFHCNAQPAWATMIALRSAPATTPTTTQDEFTIPVLLLLPGLIRETNIHPPC